MSDRRLDVINLMRLKNQSAHHIKNHHRYPLELMVNSLAKPKAAFSVFNGIEGSEFLLVPLKPWSGNEKR